MRSVRSPQTVSGAGSNERAAGVIAFSGLTALVVVFIAARTDIGTGPAFMVSAAAACVFAVVVFRFAGRASSSELQASIGVSALPPSVIHDKLLAIEEADEYFGNALKPSDMFRLICSRVGDLVPSTAYALFVNDPGERKLKVIYATGKNSKHLQNISIGSDEGLAGRAYLSGSIEHDPELRLELRTIGGEAATGLHSAIAMPLIHSGDVFAVYVLYREKAFAETPADADLLESIMVRLGPVFRSSMELERSLSNALTDPLTNLPNERAFYMVLENQIAESQRHRDDRPVSVLAIDIRGFSDTNNRFGHAAGDRILAQVSAVLREQLRKMDFLARSVNDEFMVVLPTATERTAMEILERIRKSVTATDFTVSAEESAKVELNWGWATFWRDGETASQLLRSAQLRKQQLKAETSATVLQFPKEYVN